MGLPQPQPWDRSIETRETPTAYRAFMDYCRMGPRRSLRALLERYILQVSDNAPTEKSPTVYWYTLGTWSRRHEWQRRVPYWDADQERLRTEEHNKEIADMNRRQAALGLLGQQKATVKLQSLIGKELSSAEATRLMDVATRIERVARGEPATIEGLQHSGPHGGSIPITEIIVRRPAPKEKLDKQGEDGQNAGDGDGDGAGRPSALEA